MVLWGPVKITLGLVGALLRRFYGLGIREYRVLGFGFRVSGFKMHGCRRRVASTVLLFRDSRIMGLGAQTFRVQGFGIRRDLLGACSKHVGSPRLVASTVLRFWYSRIIPKVLMWFCSDAWSSSVLCTHTHRMELGRFHGPPWQIALTSSTFTSQLGTPRLRTFLVEHSCCKISESTANSTDQDRSCCKTHLTAENP